MSQKHSLILMYGGRSGEHEISLLSASSVLAALDKTRYEITCISGDKQGKWFQHSANELSAHNASTPLPVAPPKAKEIYLSPEYFKHAYAVLPIMHGPLFEDGSLQGFLNLCNVPYVGSGHLSSAMAMDKEITKIIASSHGVSIAPYTILRKGMSKTKQLAIQNDAVSAFNFPLFIKPACMGSSVGIHRVTTHEALAAAVEDAFHYDNKVLIEKAVNGREIEVAILKEQHQISVSCAGEIRMQTKNDFYSYQAKYQDDNLAKLIAPATLTPHQLSAIQAAAKIVFEELECDGLARIDFFLNDDTNDIILNEVNTLPGFTRISMYPKLWQISGIEYPALLDKLLRQAHWQYQQSQQLLRNYL